MATQRIAFGEWLPDQPGLNGALTTAKNVISQAIGYGPFPSAVNFSGSASEDLISVFAGKQPDGVTKLFAAGLSKIYSVSSTGGLTDVSSFTGTYAQSGTTTITVTSNGHMIKTGDTVYLDFTSGSATDGSFTATYVDANTFTVVAASSATTSGNVTVKPSSNGFTTSASERFRFTQFGNAIIATNNSQRLQVWNLGTSNAWHNLSDDAPIAKFITVVRDFVVVANTSDGIYRVRWSGLNDETTWTTSQTTQSDYQDIPDGGQIMGIRGGEFGIILLERSIVRMSYIGTPFVFQFDNISRGKGCAASGSIAQYQGLTFFLSDDGFYVCDGQQVIPIGAEKVDRWFLDDVDDTAFSTMSAAVDPVRKLIIWNYKDKFAARKLIIYNFATKKWTYALAQADYVSDASTAATTLEELDGLSASIDALGTALDSVSFVGGKYFLGGTSGARVITYTGQPMTGVIETGDIQVGTSSMITLARPQVDNGSADVAVFSRRLLNEVVDFSTVTAVSADSENRVGLRSMGQYHRIQLTPTGSNWKNAMAVDIDIAQAGMR